jgi:hypothetical protein
MKNYLLNNTGIKKIPNHLVTQSLKTCFFRISESGVLSVSGPWLCEASLGNTLKGIMPITVLMENYSFKGAAPLD